jgi:hypothetical protein
VLASKCNIPADVRQRTAICPGWGASPCPADGIACLAANGKRGITRLLKRTASRGWDERSAVKGRY